jgi:trigger factor
LKTQIENVSDVKKVIHFEIPWEDVDTHVKQAVRIIMKSARIPGFRPGKAPENLVRSRYAHHIKDEVINTVIPDAYKEAIKENNGYCCCKLELIQSNICPCNDLREKEECICELYIKY